MLALGAKLMERAEDMTTALGVRLILVYTLASHGRLTSVFMISRSRNSVPGCRKVHRVG